MADGLPELYEASYRRIVRQVATLTSDLAEAEDVVQEAFSRAISRWDSVVRYDQPEAWVRSVAINLARSRFRREKRGLALRLRLEPLVRHTQAPTPDRVALVTALKTLPRPQQEALALFHLADLTIEEISNHAGVPTGTVKARLSRGRTALAKALSDEATVQKTRTRS